MAQQFRFVKEEEKDCQRKTQDFWNNKHYHGRTHDFWNSVFPFEISASSLALSGEHRSISCVRRVFTMLRIKLSCATACLVKPPNEQQRASERVGSQNDSSCFLQQVSTAITAQARGMTKGFKKSGLPWPGHQCRSMIAGGSGVLYSLPALFCKSNGIEQLIWITQALLSVMADYVYVDRESWIHGLDRFFAFSNTIFVIFRAATRLKIITTIFAIIPISTFVLANRSKQHRNLQWWIYYHFLWHLTGSMSVAFGIYLLYNCPDYVKDFSTDNYIMDQFCLKDL